MVPIVSLPFFFFLFKMLNLWMFPFPPSDLFLENGLRSFTVKMTNSFYCDTHQGYFYFTSEIHLWSGDGREINRIALCKSENTFTYYLLWVCCPMLDLMPIRHLTWPMKYKRKLEWSIHFHPSSQVGSDLFSNVSSMLLPKFRKQNSWKETPPKRIQTLSIYNRTADNRKKWNEGGRKCIDPRHERPEFLHSPLTFFLALVSSSGNLCYSALPSRPHRHVARMSLIKGWEDKVYILSIYE